MILFETFMNKPITNAKLKTMRQVIIATVFLLFAACNSMEFDIEDQNAVMTAYIGYDYWAADSLSEAYYFKNTLYISAKGNGNDITIKIKNPSIGTNENIEFLYNNNAGYSLKSTGISSGIKVTLNVLDTINAQPSIVNGTFSGQLTAYDGTALHIKQGKINNAITENLFCENSIRSYSAGNTDIGGQWELVKIINRKNGYIQNPTCKNKVYLSFYNENYLPEKINGYNCNFEINGPDNTLKGNFNLYGESQIEFAGQTITDYQTTLYNNFLEDLVFDCITSSNTYYINNTLMHLESADFTIVFYRK